MKLSAAEQQTLVEAHLPIAKSLSKLYRNQGVDAEDLYQEACMGLVEAAKRFDPDVIPSAHFGEYARSQALKRVIQAIDSELENRTRSKLTDIPAPEPDLNQERTAAEIESAAEILDPSDRDLLADRYGLYGRHAQGFCELSSRRNVPAGTLKRRLDAIRQQLKLELIKRGWRDRNGSAPKQQQLNLA